MTFDLLPVRLVADFRASAMGIKPKSPGSVATVSKDLVFLDLFFRMLVTYIHRCHPIGFARGSVEWEPIFDVLGKE